MAKIKGTNGNDTLTGTAADDFIFGYLGQDSVYGGSGYDVLTIDYSAVSSSVFPGSMALAADGTWSGGVSSGVNGGAVNVTAFENVERVVYTASQDVDYLYVDLGTLALEASRLRLDGGAGDDVLSLGASAVDKATPVTLSVAADGTIKSNVGVLSNWETFSINLGKGISNKLTLGAGDDTVISSGGKDILDLGAGNDSWSADYSARTDGVSVAYYSPAAGVSVFTAKSNLASVKNVETASIVLGSGDDTVNFVDGAGYVYGGAGDNYLVVQPTSATAALNFTLGSNIDSGALEGMVAEKSAPTPFSFNAFRTVMLGGSAGNDSFKLDAATVALTDQNLRIKLDGGAGDLDYVTFDLRAESAVTVHSVGASLSAGKITWAATGNVVDFTGIETIRLLLGAGDDTINPFIGKYVTIDGGAGIDTLDLSTATAAQLVDLSNTNGGTITDSDDLNVLATGVENVILSQYNDVITDNADSNVIVGFDGDDTFYSAAASIAGADSYYGGNGKDVITYYNAVSAVTVSLAVTTAQATGGGGLDTLIDVENVVGSKFNDTLSGNEVDNFLYGGDGNDVLEGGKGLNSIAGAAGVDTATYAHAAAGVTVSLALANSYQNTVGAGSDYLTSIENLTGSAFADTLKGDAAANVITGGRGADTLTGLGGADTFVFASKLDSSGSAVDRITDFNRSAGDKIDLRAIDAIASSTRSDDAFSYIGGNAFHGIAGELRVAPARGDAFFVYGDTNGDGVADVTILVNGTVAPLQTDFFL